MHNVGMFFLIDWTGNGNTVSFLPQTPADEANVLCTTNRLAEAVKQHSHRCMHMHEPCVGLLEQHSVSQASQM